MPLKHAMTIGHSMNSSMNWKPQGAEIPVTIKMPKWPASNAGQNAGLAAYSGLSPHAS
jgi:hypothetical protein